MKYRKRPVVVEAVQFTGGKDSAAEDFAKENCIWSPTEEALFIRTKEGIMRADPTDWIVKGVKGEFYPCKNEVFQLSYEAVEQPS